MYVLSIPLYAGSGIGSDYSWRLEHGRFSFERNPGLASESFFIAPNSEGLRFQPAWNSFGGGGFTVSIPLWMPLLFFGGLGALVMGAARDHSGKS